MPTNPSLPTVIVLASGRGERFRAAGGSTHKLQALLAGVPVLQRTLDAVRQSGLPWHLEDVGHAGMGDSIAAAVRATSSSQGWLILPGDLPLIQAATLNLIAGALASSEVVVPKVQGQRGHPVGFSSGCGLALMNLSGDKGAASVLRSQGALELPVDDIGCITDIDTPDDLAQAEQLWLQRQA